MVGEGGGKLPFDCLVLSGGGAKGAFGAGAAAGVMAYRKRRGYLPESTCFLGTSAGALNAAVLAAWGDAGPARLRDLWSEVTAKSLLGVSKVGRARALFRLATRAFTKRSAFSIYDTDGLSSLLKAALDGVDFERLQRTSHLIVIASDYSTGRLTRFYISPLIDELVARDEADAARMHSRPKLTRFVRITSLDMLIQCLLASSAIPVVFPPVAIGGRFFADGGVGNNTPVQEAALVLRAVNEWSPQHVAGDTYCVLLHSSTIVEPQLDTSFWGMAVRTYDLAHELHLGPILGSWLQINSSVSDHERSLRDFLHELETIDADESEKMLVRELATRHLGTLGGHAPRLVLPLHEIRPSASLGGVFDFDGSGERIRQGYTAAIDTLHAKSKLNEYEKEQLQADLIEVTRKATGAQAASA